MFHPYWPRIKSPIKYQYWIQGEERNIRIENYLDKRFFQKSQFLASELKVLVVVIIMKISSTH